MAGAALAQAAPFSQACGGDENGGRLVNGVCVLPATTTGGTGYGVPLMANNGEGLGHDAWSVVSGTLPPGMKIADHVGTTTSVIYDIATQTGTFTFVVKAADPDEGVSSLQTYSIKVTKPPPDKLVCSPDNGGTSVNGVCVLPGTNVGQDYEGFILTSNNSGGIFSIVAGSLPPGLSMPASYGAAGTIVSGTPTKEGTYTFTVTGTDQEGQRMQQTYSIRVGPPLPLKITFPAICCNAGKVGQSYLQDIFWSGGVGPYTDAITAGKLPPGLRFSRKPSFSITGIPTTTGTFTITITVTDGRGAHASKRGTIKIS
jgi:hypothetical protein